MTDIMAMLGVEDLWDLEAAAAAQGRPQVFNTTTNKIVAWLDVDIHWSYINGLAYVAGSSPIYPHTLHRATTADIAIRDLDLCISRWEIMDWFGADKYNMPIATHCILCVKHKTSFGCDGCPIDSYGYQFCNDTPYDEAEESLMDDSAYDDEAVEREIRFLKWLRNDVRRRNPWRI